MITMKSGGSLINIEANRFDWFEQRWFNENIDKTVVGDLNFFVPVMELNSQNS